MARLQGRKSFGFKGHRAAQARPGLGHLVILPGFRCSPASCYLQFVADKLSIENAVFQAVFRPDPALKYCHRHIRELRGGGN